MKVIPVDTSRTQFLIGAEPQPVTDRAGQQKSDFQGRPLMQVSLIAVTEGQAAETLMLKVPAPLPPLPLMTQVRVVGLSARAWAMEGKSGVSFTAVSVTPAATKQA